MAQTLAASLILAALQKQGGRVSVQLECDGPLRGVFVDADGEGNVRAYVKHPFADVQVASETFRFRPVLGNKGYISVLRDLGHGEYYRSSIELESMELGRDFERYFAASEQVESLLVLEVRGQPGEALADVSALLVQALPDGDRTLMGQLRHSFREQQGFARALAEASNDGTAALLKRLFPSHAIEMMSRYPVRFRCRCSRERVLGALAVVGKAELEDMIAKDGKADVDCDFCAAHYEISADELRALIAASSA